MFERLTADKVYLNSIRFGIQVNFPPHCGHEKAKDVDDFVKNVFDRLAAYEDSGLSPEEVQELAKAKADGRLVERGTWINGYCSNCNSPIPTDNKDDYITKNECRFCYYCGAKMEEAEKALEVGE